LCTFQGGLTDPEIFRVWSDGIDFPETGQNGVVFGNSKAKISKQCMCLLRWLWSDGWKGVFVELPRKSGHKKCPDADVPGAEGFPELYTSACAAARCPIISMGQAGKKCGGGQTEAVRVIAIILKIRITQKKPRQAVGERIKKYPVKSFMYVPAMTE
jgi:hypothetical protein